MKDFAKEISDRLDKAVAEQLQFGGALAMDLPPPSTEAQVALAEDILFGQESTSMNDIGELLTEWLISKIEAAVLSAS